MPIRLSRWTAAFLAGAMVLGSPVWAEDKAKPADSAVNSDGDAGAYLAAMAALQASDYQAAAAWYARAMLRDPENPVLLQGLLLSNLANGDVSLAADAARRLEKLGGKSQPGFIAILATLGKDQKFDAILDELKAGGSAGALADQLITAWAKLGAGNMTDALADFDKIAATKGEEGFGLYHKALAMASAGDFEGADNILSGRAAGGLAVTRRGVIAHIEILSQLERDKDALDYLDRAFGPLADPQIEALRTRLKAGEAIPFDVARTASEGMGEVFFTLATALNGQADDGYTLLFSRAAAYMRPDHTDASLLTAGLLEQLGQYDMATAVYANIKPEDPAFYVAEIGRASAMAQAGQNDASLEVLRGLARTHGDILQVQTALGDALRRNEKFVEAIKAYDAAIAMIPTPEKGDWSLFYARGICHERQGEFPLAEADMRKALELQPDEPQVLNYLGYSYVDRGINLDEALAMIKRAVAARPDSGYITDSLAWAYFRLGRYAEALAPMEQASLLEPVDPIVTDHLGDVYWSVGRVREAEFQWHRALSYGPTEKDAVRIRAKLEKGLDAVLADEGAAPLKPVDAAANGN